MGVPKLTWLGASAIVLAACASPSYVDQGDSAALAESTSLDRIFYQVHTEFAVAPPRCVAILPFELDTARSNSGANSGPNPSPVASLAGGARQGAPSGAASGADDFGSGPDESAEYAKKLSQAEAVRRAFYARLSLHGQADIELGRVDFVLSRMPAAERNDLARVGAALGCDALLIGKVTKFGSGFFGLYSSVAVGADVSIVRAWDGAVLWEGRHVARSRGGSVPVSPLGVIMSIVNAANNLGGEQFERVTDDLARRLVSTIPDTWSTDLEIFAGYGDPRNYRFVVADALNLRGGPGKAYRIQKRLDHRDVVEVVGPAFNEEWVPVKLSTGRVGYVSTRYLSDQPPDVRLTPEVQLAIAPRAAVSGAPARAAVATNTAAVPCGDAALALEGNPETGDVVAHRDTC